ncbi:hypothetical protein BD410DRAFT_572988 [Rickenella mellea]|uniref:Sister chromatid cohesion protein Dcc1 n=1 Tax=Rickenella mellea TaxID=50990 RepID=A0A4Y7QH93_9AGAM|nr:hypothetical protein BD410DRAFT_572988 [Rickenella mellea]
MTDIDLHFPQRNNSSTGCYCLLELPPELFAVMQDGTESNLTVKGRATDDAVLCTSEKTYNIRSVTLSNAFCVLTSPEGEESGQTVIRDSIQEIYELVPSISKLHRIDGILKDCEYDEGLEDDDDYRNDRPNKRARYTYSDIKMDVQASDCELDRGLREKHVLVVNGELRPISPSYLTTVLELLLTTLVSLSQSPDAASAVDLADALENDHEIRRDISMQVMSWFGELSSEAVKSAMKWKADIEAIVRQVGLGILRAHSEPLSQDELLKKWSDAVGDTFETKVSMAHLLGNYLSEPSASTASHRITYFPSSRLPLSPAERLSDLFLTRSRWKADDIAPFLADIAVDNKDRDKMLMKYARSTTDATGVTWYTAKGGVVS